MTVCELLTGKIRLACASWAMASACTWAAPHSILEPDTLLQRWVQLDSAAVSAYAPLLPSEQMAMSLWTADTALATGFGSPDVANALNAIPGVLMETRGLGGSRRLSIRGSSLRSPFAVRNTMLFVHGFCLTEADGTSPVEWLEPRWSAPLRVVSGPAATSYGGAYGGAILVEPDFQPGVAQVRTSFGTTGRSSGLQSHTSVLASERGWEARLAHAQNTGYRTWEGNERWQAELSRRWQGDKATHHTWLAVLDASWDLPGSVDSLTAAETPEFAPGGQYNAHVQRRRALAGHHLHVSDVTVFGNRSTIDVWALMRLTDKVNPFGTSPFFNGYKEESGAGASLRLRQRWAPIERPSWTIQAEWNALGSLDQGRFELWDDPVLAAMGAQLYNLTMQGWQAQWTPSVAMSHHKGWRLEASVAASARGRAADGTASDTTYSAPFNAAEWLPRVGISKALGPKLSVFSQASTGYSDPTNFETLPFEDGADASATLVSERARSVEVGLRLPGLECVLYHQSVQSPIVEQVDSLGISTFVNADAPLQMQGLETRGQWQSTHHALSLAATLQHHLLNGKGMPGSPPWMANVQWMWQPQWAPMWTAHTWIRGLGETPLNNDNTVSHPSHLTANVELTCNVPGHGVQVTLGCRNLTNTAYSGWQQVNAFGGRFYNPAPPRTFTVGLTWRHRS